MIEAPVWAWQMLSGVASSSNDEVCGLMYDNPGSPILVSIRNVSPSPCDEFEMEPDAQLRIMKARGWPQAIWHTHPRGTRKPSTVDLFKTPPGVAAIIVTPDCWVGVWLNGRQIQEVLMTIVTDIVEVYEDEGGEWRWRRKSANGATIGTSGESFDSKGNAARAAYRANPDITTPKVEADRGAGSAGDMESGAAGSGGGTTAGYTGSDAGYTGSDAGYTGSTAGYDGGGSGTTP